MNFTSLFLLLCAVLSLADRIDVILKQICDEVSLQDSRKELQNFTNQEARQLFILSGLEVILSSNIDAAIELHKKAKSLSYSTIPPLADLHLKGKYCGGLGDLYYVAAIITKQMVDLQDQLAPLRKSVSETEEWLDGLETLVTLTADSGLFEAAEAHWLNAVQLAHRLLERDPGSAKYAAKLLGHLFRGALLTPGVYSSARHVGGTRQLLQGRLAQLQQVLHSTSLQLSNIDEYSLATTFYLVYQGYSDRDFLSTLHGLYAQAYPPLSAPLLPLPPQAYPPSLPLERDTVRVGFVSSYFRRHSICKLFCELMMGLAERYGGEGGEREDEEGEKGIEVFVFSSLPAGSEDEMTRELQAFDEEHESFSYYSLGQMLLTNRGEVSRRGVDVLVYLDVGMEPTSVVWGAGRLAPLQLVTWGHPSPTGLASLDYFVSSHAFHSTPPLGNVSLSAGEYFSEQLLQLGGLGFAFPDRGLLSPSLYEGGESAPIVRRDALFLSLIEKEIAKSGEKVRRALGGLVGLLREGKSLLLLPQYLPKLSPQMDSVLLPLLEEKEDYVLVLLESKKGAWQRTLLQRWGESLSPSTLQRVLWLPSLSPMEYSLLLTLGSVMIDPFPFGGGVTALESAEACTPLLTLPSMQSVPQLAAGILSFLFEGDGAGLGELMIARSREEYGEKMEAIVKGGRVGGREVSPQEIRGEMCRRRHRLFGKESANTKESVRIWGEMLRRMVR